MPSRVLIVDDNRGVRTQLLQFLEGRTDLEVCGEAADGVGAINKARELEPDLILMDLSMPNLNGADAAYAIKKFLPHTRIIIFSIHADKVGKSMASMLGVDLIIDKAEGAAGLTQGLRDIYAAEAAQQPLALSDFPLSLKPT